MITLPHTTQQGANGVNVFLERAHKLLKMSGFWLVRDAKHGEIWTDGNSKLLCPSTFTDERAFQNFEAQVKAAKETRHKLQAIRSTSFQAPLFEVATVKKLEPEPVPVDPFVMREKLSQPKEGGDDREARGDKLILEGFSAGKKYAEIAESLNAAGIQRFSGGPFSTVDVANRLGTINKRREREGLEPFRRMGEFTKGKGASKKSYVKPKAEVQPEKKRDSFLVLPDAVVSILDAKGLDDESKVEMVMMWAEEAHAKLPEVALNILTEPSFSAALKIRMVLKLRGKA